MIIKQYEKNVGTKQSPKMVMRWEYRAHYIDENGNQKVKHLKDFRSEREAKKAAKEFLATQAGNKRRKGLNFEHVFEEYKKNVWANYKPTTVQTNTFWFDKHILPYFKNYDIKEICVEDVMEITKMTYRQRMKEYEDNKTNTGKSAVKSRSRGSNDELYRVPRSEALEMLNIDAEPSSYRPYDGQSVLPHMKNECCFLMSPIDGRYGRDEKMELAEALAHDLKINDCSFLGIIPYHLCEKDLEVAERTWIDTKEKVLKGEYGNFINGEKDGFIGHVRPKAKNASVLCKTPQGGYEKKKCFWLNKKYIKDVIRNNISVITYDAKYFE